MRRRTPCALITHPAHVAIYARCGRIITPLDIDEAAIPIARAQGWIVMGTDSDIVTGLANVPAQRNQNRSGERGED